METLAHDRQTGPLDDAEAFEAVHKHRLLVANSHISPDMRQISEFQEHVKAELAAGRGPGALAPTVAALADVIDREPFVRMYAVRGLEQIPEQFRHFPTVPEMLKAINYVISIAPIYKDVSSISYQFPLSALMNFWMGTPAGKLLMRMPQFNAAMNDVMAAWCEFLDSEASRSVLNEGSTGWLCPEALKYNQVVEDYEIPDRSAPHWGWKSYNDFFHRMVRMDMRPVDAPGDNSVINSPNDGVAWALQTDCQRDSAFWLKGQAYSLANLLANGPFVDRFVGGTVYQTYVNGGADWHGFSAPIDGTVVGAEIIRGYAWSESDVVGYDPMSGPYSQGWAAGVATRGLIYIDSHDPMLGIVCVVPIGLTEVSSLRCFVKEGQPVKKGDVMGDFSFGGSSFALVFQPGAIREILVKPPREGRNNQPTDTLRANRRCALANIAG